ncbi:MAG: NYN domain-containing protein [Mogibacterium sp.]|nr:NYN domain-containing protein [Mogibacterium sp.]
MNSKKITLGILAHVDAGKTTLSEALLYLTGEIRKPGRVDHGDAFLDDDPIERNRGITIFSRQARFSIKGYGGADTEVTLIDTPGHVDFAAEMERSLSVLDYALLVISGSEGVQAHTKTLYRLLKERDIPAFAFVNKMDIAVRKKEDILKDLASDLGAGLVDFSGAAERTEKFTDDVTLYSPELAEKVLEGEMISDDEIAASVVRGEIIPCIFGSALKIEGVEELLEVIGRYTEEPEYGKEFGARVYKTASSDDGERLSFIKITGGKLKVKDKVKVNSAAENDDCSEEKVNRILLFSGSRCVSVDSAAAGTVCAVTGPSRALPGDGLGAEPPLSGTSIRPFMVYSVNGPDGMDPYLLMKDLKLLAEEDPMLNVSRDPDGSIKIRLMGQVQLEVLQTVIKDRFGYDVSFGTGNVLYLETISGKYEGVGHFEPLRHYAEVHLIIEPGERGSGTVITSSVPEDELALNWQRLIMTHLYEKEHAGVLTGAPLTDVRITLAAGRAHEKHTVGGDFREATYRAVRNALMQARKEGRALLLEPWCEYEIELPSRSVGRAMTDIRQMGGTQDDLEQSDDSAKIRGRVPASEISGYQVILSGYTSGTGKLSCTPCGYEECHDAAAVIEEKGYDPERDVENPADSVFVNHSGSDIVKWDEVTEHMHIGSVLKRKTAYPAYGHTAQNNNASAGSPDAKEEAKRRIAAEKELRNIFERTYGTSKKTRYREATERDYRNKPDISAEEAARNEARNQEIKARREHKTEKREEKPVMILIDGYNIIFADDYLKELFARDGGSARDQLIDRLGNYAGYTGFEVSVVFDAYNVPQGEVREQDHNGVRVIFTAENEPADIRMGIMTGSVKDRQIYVVSSDSLVQQDAWTHGALRFSSREFLAELSRIEEEIRDHLRRSN